MSEDTNPVIIITGGSRGIGLATVHRFLNGGARVAICAKNAARLAKLKSELAAGVREILTLAADVSEARQVRHFVAQVAERFGRIDVLVNNAGRLTSGNFANERLERIDEVIDVNLKGLMYVTHAVLPHMLKQRRGVIVNVSSGAGISGFAGLATYCASKFGVNGFTESLNLEVQAFGVRVYAICPGRVATDMQAQYAGRRIGMPPERVADSIVALAGAHPPIAAGQCLVLSA